MNAAQNFLEGWPAVQAVLDAASVALPLAAFLSYCGLGLISALAKILSHARKRASFDKCARQLALLGFILGWIMLVGVRVWLFLTPTGGGKAVLLVWLAEICWLLLAVSVLLASLYYALWKHTAKYPALGISLGLSGGLAACAALFCALATARFTVLGLTASATDAKAGEIFAALSKIFVNAADSLPLWNMLWYTPALIVALAGGLGALWLFARRNHDDFGRDHYNAMIAWCTSLSRNAWLLLWCFLLIFCVRQLAASLNPQLAGTVEFWQEIATEAAYLLYWAIPALLWTFVGRSQTPLRCSIAVLAAFALACTFLVPYYLEICAV
ncbi:MAG: hypothetical protein LBR31_08185 [Desulfovibrio sp.]|jgi:hypothetical protein|nr:hypothetical protein [Desulfovibrio sp.]